MYVCNVCNLQVYAAVYHPNGSIWIHWQLIGIQWRKCLVVTDDSATATSLRLWLRLCEANPARQLLRHSCWIQVVLGTAQLSRKILRFRRAHSRIGQCSEHMKSFQSATLLRFPFWKACAFYPKSKILVRWYKLRDLVWHVPQALSRKNYEDEICHTKSSHQHRYSTKECVHCDERTNWMDIIRFQHLLILPTFLKGKIATTFQPTDDRIVISTILQPTWYLEDIWLSNCLTKVQTVPGPKPLPQEALEGMPVLHPTKRWSCSRMSRRTKRGWVQPRRLGWLLCLHTHQLIWFISDQITSIYYSTFIFVLLDGLFPMLYPAEGVQWSNVNSDSKFWCNSIPAVTKGQGEVWWWMSYEHKVWLRTYVSVRLSGYMNWGC